jgi:hypothetical protein
VKRPAFSSWRLVAALSGGIVLLVAACHDATITSPPTAMKHAAATAANLDDPGGGGHPEDAPEVLSLSLPAPNVYNGQSTLSGNLGRYRHPTIVHATISGGMVTYTPNYDNIGPSQGPFGPEGRIVLFYWDGFQTRRFDFGSSSMYIPIVGAGEVFTVARAPMGTLTLTGYRPVIPGPFIFCGPMWGNPCFSYGGDAGTVNLRRLSSQLQATAEKENAQLNETPYIDYRANPMVVEGQNMPFVVDSTHWIPDPPELGGSPTEQPVHAKGEGACQRIGDAGCRHRMLGSGTFKVDAWVNGKRFSKSVHISVGTEKVDITPIPDRTPTITIPQGSLCTQKMTEINQRNIRVTVTRSDGSPVAGRQVKITLTAVDGGGGHLASGHSAPRVWGSIPQDVLTTDASGKAVVLWTIPEFSGPVKIRAELVGVSGTPDEETVNILVPGLEELTENKTKYTREGIKPELHPQSHFGLSALIKELKTLTDSTSVKAGKLEGFIVGINDMSLPLGGRFDVTAKGEAGGRWNDSPHHCSHRSGNAADFKTNGLTSAQRKRVILIWEGVLNHSKKDENDHWHLKLPPEPKPAQEKN